MHNLYTLATNTYVDINGKREKLSQLETNNELLLDSLYNTHHSDIK
jgi:hypothetical protein